MTAGLTIYNDDFDIQIDSDYTNLSLISTMKIPAQGEPIPPYDGEEEPNITTAWTSKPIFALQPLPINSYQTIYRRIGNGFIHIFEDIPRNSIGSGFGLEVYKDDGTIAYSSKYKDVKIIDYVKMSIKSTVEVDFFSKGYGSTNIAVIPTVVPIGFSLRYGTPMAMVYGIYFALTSTGVLKATMQSIGSVPIGAAENMNVNSYRVEFLVIDTTSY